VVQYAGVSPRRSATRPAPRRAGPPGQAASSGGSPGTPGSWLWLSPPPRASQSAGWALLPLRAFLGFTFTFAGLQKLANPGFFHASNPASIQSQLAGAAHRSPIHSLLTPLVHVAVPLGILVALAELAVGVGTLLGLYGRVAAAGGMAISFSLFLAVSFHSNPYFTGSDIVFFFAWTPLLVAGVGPLSADAVIHNLARRAEGATADTVVPIPFSEVRRVCGSYVEGACTARHGEPCQPGPCPYLRRRPDLSHRQEGLIERRAVLAKGTLAAVVGGAALVSGGIAAAVGRIIGGASPSSTSVPLSNAAPPSSAPTTSAAANPGAAQPAPSTTSTTAATHPPGTRLGPASAVPVGGAASFQDPASGDPGLVIQPQRGTFLAFDAVCPHAGCTVEYSSRDQLFVCPCHGSQFNGHTGAVEVGPAQSGLSRISVAEGSDGQLYAR